MHQIESRQQPVTTTPSLATKAERLIAFRRAVASGCSLVEAAKAAGISDRTATRWRKDMGTGSLSSKDAASAVATKGEAATILTAIARNDGESAAYRVAAVDKLSKVMGYDAPTRTEVIQVNATVEQWLEATERRERLGSGNGYYVNQLAPANTAPTKALRAHDQPRASAQPAQPVEQQAPGAPPKADS